MARIRYLKPEFFSDEDLADLPFQARLAFAGLWCYADKAGRLEDRPKFLKAMIFPYDNVDMEKQLDLLCQGKHGNGVPFIQRYEAEGKKLIQILSWERHQKPHHTEADSKIPPAPPFKEKIKEKGMGMEKQLGPSDELRDGEATVKEPLSVKLQQSDFDKFWILYPSRYGKKTGRKESEEFFFKTISQSEIGFLLIATRNYSESKTVKDGYAKDAIRFLKKDFWRDWIDPPGKEAPKYLHGLKEVWEGIDDGKENPKEAVPLLDDKIGDSFQGGRKQRTV